MKKLFKEYKFFFWIALLLIVFGLLLLWPQKKVEEKSNSKTTTSTTKIVGIVQRADEIDWSESKIEIPEKVKVLKQNNGFINGEKLETLLKAVDMVGAPIVKSDSYYVIYKNEKATLYIKLREKQIDYQLTGKMKYAGTKDSALAISHLKGLVGKLGNRQLGEPEVDYFKDEFRAYRTNIFTADFMEIYMNFLHNNIPLMSYQGGSSIKAQYSFDGKLWRLIIFNPFEELVEDSETKILAVNEIKVVSSNLIPIFKIKGNKEFAFSPGEEKISSIKSSEGKLAYVFEPKDNKYIPYLITSGQTKLTSGNTEIIFGVPLINENK